jgi:hypothetical protein
VGNFGDRQHRQFRVDLDVDVARQGARSAGLSWRPLRWAHTNIRSFHGLTQEESDYRYDHEQCGTRHKSW